MQALVGSGLYCESGGLFTRKLARASLLENPMNSTTALQTFTSSLGFSIRTVERNGEPWFVAADVCGALEVKNPRHAISRLDEDERNTVVLNDGIRGNPNFSIVSESGLYTLMMGSRKPEAKTFKRWVTHEVLPTIRKTGRYETTGAYQQQDISNRSLLERIAFAEGVIEGMERLHRNSRYHPNSSTNPVGDVGYKGAPRVILPKVFSHRDEILIKAGARTTMAEIFEGLKAHGIQRDRGSEMAVSSILKGAGYVRYAMRVGSSKPWGYRRG